MSGDAVAAGSSEEAAEADPLRRKQAQLEGYIQASRDTQRQLWWLSLLGAAISIVAWVIDSRAGLTALVITVFVALIGFYITGMHISEWQQELYKLRKRARKRSADK